MSRKFDAMASAKVFSGRPEETPKNLALIQYPALCSIKYDGWRMFEYNGEVRCRSMKPPKNRYTQKRMAELFASAAALGLKGMDGEACAGDPMDHNVMQHSSSLFNSYDKVRDFTFLVFDSYQYPEKPFVERLKYVTEGVLRLQEDFPWVQPVDHVLLHTEQEVMDFLEKIESLGGEGIMGRSLDGKYKMGRSTMKQSWLWALKPYADAEAEIIGFQEELENRNEAEIDERGYTKRSGHQENMIPKGRLGKFICRSPIFNEEFSVGAGIGLTHDLRQEVWDNQDQYLGRHLKFKYQAVGVKDRPRQPKFMGFREVEDMARR